MLKASQSASRIGIRVAAVLLGLCALAAMAQAAQPAPEGRMVRVETAYGTYFEGYLAGPGDAPLGVVLVHDRWGLNAQVKAWADRVAGLGYRTLAIDLFDGRVARKPEDGLAIWRSIDPVWTVANMDGALRYMRAGQAPVVAIGWGKGIRPLGDLLRRSPAALAGLVLYYDNDTLDEADHLPARPAIPVLDITVGRSPVHPGQDVAQLGAGGEEAWQATSQFLTRFGQ